MAQPILYILPMRETPKVEVGDIWRLDYDEEYSKKTYHYLILKMVPSDRYNNLCRVLCLDDGRVTPDLIIDSGTVQYYNAQKVA
jgi:hypothetical protein